ncbi:hypothetical protein PFISCL1PPCAC_12373, partial [Pristionchus fissidentatus]
SVDRSSTMALTEGEEIIIYLWSGIAVMLLICSGCLYKCYCPPPMPAVPQDEKLEQCKKPAEPVPPKPEAPQEEKLEECKDISSHKQSESGKISDEEAAKLVKAIQNGLVRAQADDESVDDVKTDWGVTQAGGNELTEVTKNET